MRVSRPQREMTGISALFAASSSRAKRLTQTASLLVIIVILLIYAASSERGLVENNNSNTKTSPPNNGTFGSPPCDASGECHEHPDVPSPRTVYSARTQRQYDLWWKAHAALNQSAAHYVERRAEGGGDFRSLVLMGDSITESYLGTGMGEPRKRSEGIPDVLADFAESERFDPLVLAISGDQTQHLLYRLQHGELLPPIADDKDAVFVILIGTNNLGSGELPKPTADGIVSIAKYILSNTVGRIVLVEVLPRGDGKNALPQLCPPRCNSGGKPFKSFMPAVDMVNDALRKTLPDLSQKYDNRLSLVNCGSSFLIESSKNAEEVDVGLMPDRLHPNADGQRILLQCVVDCINGKC